MVRITGGSHRGRMLVVPAGLEVRPTASRVREAVFSMLGSRLSGAWVLDLFAGSGLLGLEALSRGAEGAVFVDSNPRAVAAIQENIHRLHLEEKAFIVRGAVLHPATLAGVGAILARGNPGVRALDLVFMDPPYGHNLVSQTLSWIQPFPACISGTLAIVEHEMGLLPDPSVLWKPLQNRRYGDTRISILERTGVKE